MRNAKQSIEHPFGINVFGSSTIRVEPDIAFLNFAVSRLAQQPKDAFHETREGAQNVHTFLSQAQITDVGSSRVTLTQTYKQGAFAGYTARIAFHVLLHDLGRIEETLVGVVEAGAYEVTGVYLQTSKLKEIRAEARRQAVRSAREKAEIYCRVAGINVGPIIHIEDINPDVMDSVRFHNGDEHETPLGDDETPHAINPESIIVNAAVMLSFEIGR